MQEVNECALEFWARVMTAPETGHKVTASDFEEDCESDTIVTLCDFYEALAEWDANYAGDYEDFVCALTREYREAVRSSQWPAELKHIAGRFIDVAAYIRFCHQDAQGSLPDGPLLFRVATRLKSPELWDLLYGLLDVDPVIGRRLLSRWVAELREMTPE